MKLIVPLIFLSLLFFRCKDDSQALKKKTYDSFVFSKSTEAENYSLKFQNNDTVFLQKRFPPFKKNLFTVIGNNDSKKLDSFLKAIDFAKFDTLYVQNYLQDGAAYKFCLTKDTLYKWSFIYGQQGPKVLYEFAEWLRELKGKQYFRPINSSIDFGDLRYIVLPNVPPPPKTENNH